MHPRDVVTPRALPAMPTDAFRLVRVAAHPAAEDSIIFRTSGTTGGARGEHPLSTTKTYEEGALAWGQWALFFDQTQVDEGDRPRVRRPPSRRPTSRHFIS